MIKKELLKKIVPLALAIGLTSCSGGGGTPTPTPVVTPTPTLVVTPTPTPVVTPTPTPVVTPTPTLVVTPTPTPVVTPAPTPVVTPVNLTQLEKVNQLKANNYTCTPNKKIELLNSYAISSGTNCVIPNQSGLIYTIPDSNAVLQIISGTPTVPIYTNSTNNNTNLQAEIANYNSRPQALMSSSNTLILVERINTGNQTTSQLDTIILDFSKAKGLTPVIGKEYSPVITGNSTTSTISSGVKSLPVKFPLGPNYTLDSAIISIINTTGTPTGQNLDISLVTTGTNQSLEISVPVGLSVQNGNYTLGAFSFTDNLNNTIKYNSGKITFNKTVTTTTTNTSPAPSTPAPPIG